MEKRRERERGRRITLWLCRCFSTKRERWSFTFFLRQPTKSWKKESKGKKLSGTLAYRNSLYMYQAAFQVNVIQFPPKINWSPEVDFNLKWKEVLTKKTVSYFLWGFHVYYFVISLRLNIWCKDSEFDLSKV